MNIRKAGAAALASTLLLALPGTALATGGDHDGHRGDRARGNGFGDVPSRIANKLRSAERAMERAQDHADDAEPGASAASPRAAVTRHSAQKSVARRVAAGDAGGPAAAAALARTQGEVIDAAIGLFDGAPIRSSTADATTLKAALDGRDALVAAIVAIADHGAYRWALRTSRETPASEAAGHRRDAHGRCAHGRREGGADRRACAGDRDGGRRPGSGRDAGHDDGPAGLRAGHGRAGKPAEDCPPGQQRRREVRGGPEEGRRPGGRLSRPGAQCVAPGGFLTARRRRISGPVASAL